MCSSDLDSDDFLDSDYIESFYTSMVQEEADIVYGDLYDPDKKEVYLKSRPYDKLAFLNGELYFQLFPHSSFGC